ncbi:C-C motif chemokine 27a [Brachionichthys hirsutus]|uniref:C-C motif chemokine 27a n=1 Tax=Brachionichthys hirsutus TaxID=412623 RepID=UPI003604B1E8
MDLKVAIVVVCLCALTITPTEAGIPKCCITTKRYIPPQVLFKVRRFDVQQITGACDIPALILHIKDKKKPMCAHPKVKRMLTKILGKRKIRISTLGVPK